MPEEKVYIGTKIIKAHSCKNFKPGGVYQEGYKIVDEDGCESWSPKEIFERCYREISKEELVLANLL